MSEGPQYGPNNPHPLSKRKTELVWEGKYDEYGNRREAEVAGADLPLQKVESIDAPYQAAQGGDQLGFWEQKNKRQDDFRNMLIWGDNKLVMASLLRDFRGKIDLIYIDPPFDVGADFTMGVAVGDSRETVPKDQSILEAIAYRDMWGKGTESYIHAMYERFLLMKDLLTDKGLIFVHLAPTVSHYLRLIMDEVFGTANFRSEIIVHRPISKNLQRQFETITSLPQGHDSILCYSARPEARYRNLLIPYEAVHPEGYWHRFWSGADRPTMRYELLGETLTHGQWKWSEDRAKKAVENYERYQRDARGRALLQYWQDMGRQLEFVRSSATGTVENWFPPAEDKVADTVWDDIKAYENQKDFPTQKHRELLTRMVEWVTDEGDLVADLFCGSGTTGAVAEKLGRRWIMCDLGRYAIHTSRKRTIELQRQLYDEGKPYRAFDVYNLGRYERQWWQAQALEGADEQHREIVLAFYRAEPLTGASSPLLHGRKGPALVTVDGIDSILTLGELRPIVEAAQAAGAKEVHCLAWEFEMDLKRNAEALEHEFGVKARLIRIPREVMEKNRRPGVDEVPFFEMATLAAEPIVRVEGGVRTVEVKLTNFLPSLSEVPSKELKALKERAVKSGFDFIDFWAVDFDHHDGQPFNHHWQDYRLRKDRTLKTVSDCGHEYQDTEPHTICVKVIDVFGCDTSTLLEVSGAGGTRSQSATSKGKGGR